MPATHTRPQLRVVRVFAVPVTGASKGVGTGTWSGKVLGHQPLNWMFILSTDLVHMGATVCNSPANFKLD